MFYFNAMKFAHEEDEDCYIIRLRKYQEGKHEPVSDNVVWANRKLIDARKRYILGLAPEKQSGYLYLLNQ